MRSKALQTTTEESAQDASPPAPIGTQTPDAGSDRWRPVNDSEISACVEGVLLSVDRPVSAAKLARALSLDANQAERIVRVAIDALNAQYEATGRAFRIQQVAGGFRVMTTPAVAPAVAAFHRERQQTRLSRAAVETLAVIAYRQPVTRAEVEAIRGVACGEVLKTLLERRMLVIAGRAEEVGRPMLYGTSRQFLEVFGLASIKDLPDAGEFLAGAAERAAHVVEPKPTDGEAPLDGAPGAPSDA